MILMRDYGLYLSVFKCDWTDRRSNKPRLSADNIGQIVRCGDVWKMDFLGRDLTFWDHLDGSEKRQIIGLLDKLNGIIGRPQSDMRRRWNEIIGLWVADTIDSDNK